MQLILAVRKLNIVDIVLQLFLWRICIEIAVAAATDAIRDTNVKREHDSYDSSLRAALIFSISASVARAATKAS